MDTPLRTVRTNIVQSIRAFRVSDLQEAAQGLGHHFLYANLAEAQTKQDVLALFCFTQIIFCTTTYDNDTVADKFCKQTLER